MDAEQIFKNLILSMVWYDIFCSGYVLFLVAHLVEPVRRSRMYNEECFESKEKNCNKVSNELFACCYIWLNF